MFSTGVSNHFIGGKDSLFSEWCWVSNWISMWGQGMNFGSYLTPFATNQLKTTMDLNMKVKTIKLLEEIRGGNLPDFEGRQRFLRKYTKNI